MSVPEIFADGIVNVSHANGVFRITFGQQEPEGAVKPSVKLLIPATQMTPVIQALGDSVQDISKKIEEQSKDSAPRKPGTRKKSAAKK